jgi:4-hydroxy-tetrahydrodipicolinate reductase
MAGKKIRVIHFGLGPIGCGIVRVVAARPDYQIVGAIDIDPAKAGKDLGEIVGLARKLGVKVSGDAAKALKTKAEVVVHCTGSYLAKVEPQLSAIMRANHNVVSTCEELAEPWSHGAVAKRIDGLAKKSKVAILGTGINPGFMMDTLPLTLTSICQQVKGVRVSRIVDAAGRREPLQRKIGTGLSVEDFNRKRGEGNPSRWVGGIRFDDRANTWMEVGQGRGDD